jgi:hypothetical protein
LTSSTTPVASGREESFNGMSKALSEPKVTDEDLADFAARKVNLPGDVAREKRKQVNTLRDRLEAKIAADPRFSW